MTVAKKGSIFGLWIVFMYLCFFPDEATTGPPAVKTASKESPLPVEASCTSPSVLCPGSSLCISPAHLCDGRADCPDGSDESNCLGSMLPTAQTEVPQCHQSAKLCDDGKRCVLFSHLCDGESDCLDGSDERGCPETCKPGYLTYIFGLWPSRPGL